MKNLIYILTILLFSCNNSSKQTENNSADSTLTEQQDATTQGEPLSSKKEIIAAKKFELKNQDRPTEDTLILKTDGKEYFISPLGLLKTNSSDTIQLETDLIVNRAYLHETQGDFYVFFTETDHEGATSWVQKISKNGLKSVYVEQIQGFNLGQPIIDGESAYVTAIGFIGKFNLQTGSYEWKHHNLYDNEKYSFNSFDTVLINKTETKFISENYSSKKTDKVLIDNYTGEIKRIEK